MKFNVGYALKKDKTFINTIIEHKDKIDEVYFSYADMPSGRNSLALNDDYSPNEIAPQQINDLKKLYDNGLNFNLLFNANCYGAESQSKALMEKVGDTLDYFIDLIGVKSVTTTSFLIAKFIKANFSGIEVRSSVNTSFFDVNALEMSKDYFDGFYAPREYNRDIEKLSKLKAWCDEKGKRLYGLANSGCFAYCPARTFHDNLVAHESEISKLNNGYNFTGLCKDYLRELEDKSVILSNLTFIRPEDVSYFEGYFDAIKLATRVSYAPEKIVKAYVNGNYGGSLVDLLEPNYQSAMKDVIIDNSLLPENFAKQVSSCNKNCKECGYCKKAFDGATVKLDYKIF